VIHQLEEFICFRGSNGNSLAANGTGSIGDLNNAGQIALLKKAVQC